MTAKFPGRPQSLRVRLLPLWGAVARSAAEGVIWVRTPSVKPCRACHLPHKGGFGSAVKFLGRPQSLRVRLLPLGGAVAQRLRGFQSAEHKKSFSEATWIFCMEPNSFGVTRGEQPLVRASRASKVAGAFLVLFWHAKENLAFPQQRFTPAPPARNPSQKCPSKSPSIS